MFSSELVFHVSVKVTPTYIYTEERAARTCNGENSYLIHGPAAKDRVEMANLVNMRREPLQINFGVFFGWWHSGLIQNNTTKNGGMQSTLKHRKPQLF